VRSKENGTNLDGMEKMERRTERSWIIDKRPSQEEALRGEFEGNPKIDGSW
tara:strand:+ start:413 stop:565 length:153 start_codon:yes stop_codon:yes gene_type:complete